MCLHPDESGEPPRRKSASPREAAFFGDFQSRNRLRRTNERDSKVAAALIPKNNHKLSTPAYPSIQLVNIGEWVATGFAFNWEAYRASEKCPRPPTKVAMVEATGMARGPR